MKRSAISLFVFIVPMLLLGFGCQSNNDPPTLTVGDHILHIEIADTPPARRQGLSDRIFLEDNRGVLFVFPRPSQQSFWMYRCHFDIDLAYIDSRGVIDEIITMKKEPMNTPPNQLRNYPSKSSDIQYVLEVNQGWFKRHGVKPGLKLDVTKYKTMY